jgi:hypothetical protein
MNSKPLVLALAAFFTFGCSGSADDASGPGTRPTNDERRIPIGKEDSLAGSCTANGQKLCGGKSKKKCWCDAACSQFGDCCADYAAVCGPSGSSCESTADCPSGQFCSSPDGCASLGTCKPFPTDVACTAVVLPYCGCDGVTKQSTSGCIYDRFAHSGACTPPTTSCGGFANLPCPAGQMCVDAPDSCDPQNGGADCPGMCVPGSTGGPKSCDGKCGGPSADKSCYCDGACKGYGDCCQDYDQFCGERTPASGQCVKNSNDACSSDADCKGGGCGGELCYNPELGSGISTCECTAPTNVAGCGCVAGKCTWYN